MERVVSHRQCSPVVFGGTSCLRQGQPHGSHHANELASAVTDLDSIIAEVDHVEISADLASAAGDLVLVTGDTDLAAAASVLGISVAATNS